MRKDNDLLRACDDQPRGFEETPWFWVLMAVCLGMAVYLPFWVLA